MMSDEPDTMVEVRSLLTQLRYAIDEGEEPSRDWYKLIELADEAADELEALRARVAASDIAQGEANLTVYQLKNQVAELERSLLPCDDPNCPECKEIDQSIKRAEQEWKKPSPLGAMVNMGLIQEARASTRLDRDQTHSAEEREASDERDDL